jgi:phage terminase large subunit-like protein
VPRKKAEHEIRGHRTKAELAARRRDENPDCSIGLPPRPTGLDRNFRNAWNKRAGQLLRARLLARTDGDALMRLVEADLVGDAELMKGIFTATWGGRAPFPEPQPGSAEAIPAPAETRLADFLAGVWRERETFAQRMLPTETVTLDVEGVAYQWPTGDPAEVARKYALDITQGTHVAGELIQRAAARFISDIERGHERGLYFDPAAARHICQFSEQFCGLILLPWQVFVLANIFGWKKPTGARRFTEAWVSCAKKNGKTRLASCVALWGLVADCEKYPDVFSAATKKEQSRLVWRDARRAVQDNPELSAHVQRWAGALAIRDTDGSFTPLSSDEKSMDGLRPHVIIADEVAFWADREQWDKLVKGTVSRVSPLTFAVTTAGSTKQCFAFGKFDLGEKILRGIYNDESTFVAIFAIDKADDPLDETCWPKANPSLGVTLKEEHLRKTRDEAAQDGSGLNAWLQYHCNIWCEVTLQRQGSIAPAKWEACAGSELIAEGSPWKNTIKFLQLNSDTPCLGGLDVGLTSDMSAFALLFPRARFAEGAELQDKKVLVVQFFMPEVGLLEKEKAWQVPLSMWAREGWIQLLPGDLTDPREIRKFIIQMASRFAIREVGFDSWNSQVLCAEINESGAVSCVAVPQTPKELTAPAREFLTAIHSREIVHFGNPCLAWHVGNVVLAEDPKHGGTKPEKLSPNEKIDGVAATLNAWHRFLAAPLWSHPYNERGLILL